MPARKPGCGTKPRHEQCLVRWRMGNPKPRSSEGNLPRRDGPPAPRPRRAGPRGQPVAELECELHSQRRAETGYLEPWLHRAKTWGSLIIQDQDATTMDVTQEPLTTAPSPCRGSGVGTGCEVEADADNNKH
ncbi:uncharacterized protein ACIBXB_022132 isoform 1-T1 [Morphnus guianensis]